MTAVPSEDVVLNARPPPLEEEDRTFYFLPLEHRPAHRHRAAVRVVLVFLRAGHRDTLHPEAPLVAEHVHAHVQGPAEVQQIQGN
eukprot:CAMPEP_0115112792 /NCGR_PEP_ID=MMETSP0227-20121206/40904_1 /TAXON_ID=89957 /ORGANISM="Polarella glacialis, Strain CCMP 1383" /LENGTH=84 /DNA_ID=CAMNT_0002512533 /DNA_START=506 /DNA_END=760 /DNA_ORIENTATION=-